jgi:cytochrome c biogenesis protein CcmG/thiol:disulfide interchange protein DsbE
MVPSDELDGYGARSRWRKILVPGLLSVAVIAAGLFAVRPAPEKPVPHFVLPLLDGSGTLSSRSLEGKPVVLNFFASWCDPCRDEAPRLESAYRRYADDGVRFVGVDIRDTPENARRFVDELGISFPVVRDPSEKLARGLDVVGLPQTFFIDSQWRLSSMEAGERLGERSGTAYFGAITQPDLEAGIEALLDEAPER